MKYLTVEHETDTAHRLSFHKGKCKNIHGHRYKFVVSIEVTDNFVDFYDLKQYVRQKLDDYFDHAIILCENPANLDIIRVLEEENLRVKLIEKEPTVENMVDFVKDYLQRCVAAKEAFIFNLCQLTIYETPTNYCTWRRD